MLIQEANSAISDRRQVCTDMEDCVDPNMRTTLQAQERFLSARVLSRVSYYGRTKIVFELLEQNLDQALRLRAVAHAVSMNATSFSRYFRDKIGLTFSKFVRNMKVSHAATYLEDSDTPISEVAAMLGFQSVATFIRSFKNVTGFTPSAYRQNIIRSLSDGGVQDQPATGLRQQSPVSKPCPSGHRPNANTNLEAANW